MKGDSQQGPVGHPSPAVATRFVAARRSCRALPAFPGELPDSLEHAYQCQEAAIELWGEAIGGWKVGRVPPELEAAMGSDRLAGPIFSSTIRPATADHRAADQHPTGDGSADDGSADDGSWDDGWADDGLAMPVYQGGFAAVEAEFVAVIGADAPPDKLEWTLAEAAGIIGDLRIGLEVASSPLPTINDIGPLAVVSDFGNNAGLIVGPSIKGWRDRALTDLCCETFVDGRSVGRGGAASLSGGYLRSVQFMLGLAARRGRPLTRGTFIATGQTTGIHDVLVGQRAVVDFGPDGRLQCRVVAQRVGS